jgi:hypothetical protein
MKQIIILIIIFAAYLFKSNAQTSPCRVLNNSYQLQNTNNIRSVNDTVTFSSFVAGTVITSQYLNKGVVFSGYGGSAAPEIYNYGAPSYYGNVLKSDNWYNPLRINFTDTSNASVYHLAKKIELDNVVGYGGEVDYMSIDVYDSVNVLIYHYLSTSPEHVVLNFTVPVAAYITIDDSASTAYVVDNILIDNDAQTGLDQTISLDFKIYPNPFLNQLTIGISGNEHTTIILYDAFSRQILQKSFTASTTIDTEQLADGIYFYQLRNEQNITARGKVIKH